MSAKTILTVLATLVAIGVNAKECHEYKLTFIPKATTPIVIDGKIDEAAWKAVEPIVDFAGTYYSYRLDALLPRTEVRFLWDEKYFYASARCWEDTPENWKKFLVQMADTSGLVHNHDCIELHLNGPNPGERPHYQAFLVAMPVKSLIHYYDSGWGEECDNDYGRIADWEQKYVIGKDADGKDCWTVETRIAHASLGTDPRVGFRLGFNVARFRWNKNFVTTKGEPTTVNYLQDFCWGPAKFGQHCTKYSRGIFVDKVPASVVEGLRLSYPDLDRRTVLVQTDKAYVVVKDGKTSELGYLDKARALLKEAAEGNAKLVALSNAVPEPKKDFWKRNFAAADGALRAIAAKAEQYAAATSCDVGELTTMQADAEKWKLAFETCYYASLRQLMLAEGKVRFPVKLVADPKAPKLEEQFTGCKPLPWVRKNEGVRWMRPGVTGTKNVFFVVSHGDAYAAWELMHRLDLTGDVFVVQNEGSSVRHWQEWRYDEAAKLAMLETAFATKQYDGYVFIGASPEKLPLKIQCALAERMLAGARTVTINGRDWGGYALKPDASVLAGFPQNMYRLQPVPNPAVRVSRDSGFDTKRVLCQLPPMYIGAVGRGSYATWKPGESATYREKSSLLPGWNYLPCELFQDEYSYATAAKVVATALGLTGANRLAGVSAKPTAALKEITVNVLLDCAAKTKIKTVLILRDNWGAPVAGPYVAEGEMPAGKSHVTFAVKGQQVGRYYADAFIIDGATDYDGLGFTKAKTADYASASVDVICTGLGPCGCSQFCRDTRTPAKILAVKPVSKPFRKDQDIAATVIVSNAVKGLRIAAALRDPKLRIIEQGEFEIEPSNGIAKVSFPWQRLYENCHFIVATLLDAKGDKVDGLEVPIYRKTGRRDDFIIFTDGFYQGGINGLKRQATLQYTGMDLCQNGSPARLFFGGDPGVRDRLSGSGNECDCSLSSPYHLNKLRQRYRDDAMLISQYNGLFLSLGDDSGVPLKFTPTSPDWIEVYFDDLDAKFTKESAKGADFYQLRRNWQRSRHSPITDVGWGFYGKYRPLGSFAKNFITLKFLDDDLKDIVSACKRAYSQPKGLEIFNRQNGLDLKSWNELTLEKVAAIKPSPSSEFVHFQFWLRDSVYGGDIAKLNAAWHSSFADFFAINEDAMTELSKARHYGADLDKRRFFRELLKKELGAVRAGVASVDPTIGSFMGCAGYANSAEDGVLTLGSTCPYWGRHKEVEHFRSHGTKDSLFGQTLGTYNACSLPRDQRDWDVWRMLYSGANLCWYWSTFCSHRGDLSLEDGMSGFTCDALREIKRGPASLLLRSKRENDGLYILSSTKSGALEGLRSEFAIPVEARKSFMSMLEGAGFQYDFLFSFDLEQGVLAKGGVKTLVLTAAQILSAKEAAAIRSFVEKGGTVVADYRPGVCAENGDLLAKGQLDDVFGITRTATDVQLENAMLDCAAGSANAFKLKAEIDATYRAAGAKAFAKADKGAEALFVNSFGKGKAVLLNFCAMTYKFAIGTPAYSPLTESIAALVGEGNGVKRPCVVRDAAGAAAVNSEVARFTRGGAEYVAFQKTPYASEKFPMAATIDFAKPAWTYDVRAGKALGRLDKIPVTLKGFDTALFARLPYAAQAMNVVAPKTVKPGETLVIDATLVAASGSQVTGTPVFRVDLVPPGGYSFEKLAPIPYRLLDAPKGKLHHEVAIGYNAPKGLVYTLEVTDIATGIKYSQPVTVVAND